MALVALAVVSLPSLGVLGGWVLGYTIWTYRAFAGKVDIASKSNHY